MDLGGRIRERIYALGLSQAELARRVGISQPSINHLIKSGAQGSKHLHSIARVLKTTPEYLAGQTDDPSAGYVPAPSPEMVASELGIVPIREIDLRFGMGATDLEVPVTTTVRHFSRDWIKQYTGASPDHLYFAQGIGDSMAPTILDTDLLLIDASERDLRLADKIWAIAYGHSGMVKRLRSMADGSVKILSDNQAVPPELAYDGELHILGRVVAVMRKI
ncbi:Phage repressor protein C, contains Cro/C1-type HTH and peptisase s24 domains [Sphingomonas laterariae]|uniref:Phage repressor protein C, contains Cro/C1-type HTH and peptisase s24 domains n=1 Tax=Edaphosphingomonas laterariae TaxID=861865 RepID=A0A239CKX6_9SPHN|nr:S24 family peptidase [Sphingomonas laterariae]SNS20825.1 Phage repressor protein C, contains Cro/C1-type HTH and peptisase s24 domains [Sphingomonas laterariae]